MNSLVRAIENLEKAPKSCFITLKLNYYDEVTPYNYQPPHFYESNPEELKTIERGSFAHQIVSIDEFKTDFHSFMLNIKFKI